MRPGGASRTLSKPGIPGSHHLLALEGLNLLREPLNLMSLGSIHCYSTINPPSLLLREPLILSYVLLTTTSLCGALGLVV